jgi:nicotinamidase-related amidase
MSIATPLRQFPDFYDQKKVGDLYLSRKGLVAEAAEEWARRFKIAPAIEDRFKIALFAIDEQIDFILALGSLSVPGAIDDSVRLCDFIYRYLPIISSLNFSLDTHKMFQIFHAAFWWDNVKQCHPGSFTLITAESIRAGRYSPLFFPQECLEYIDELERTGKYVLTIRPYHTELGDVGHAMLPAIFEAATFHAVARRKQFHLETKGLHPLTENYSVLSPEVKKLLGKIVGQFNTKFFKMLLENDRVYVAGQASSHCVRFTLEDVLREIMATDPTLVDKIYILEDCMSPVPAIIDSRTGAIIVDFPKMARDALDSFRAAGMHVVKSTDPIDLPFAA